MISLYGLYIQEREGLSIIERDSGFATYKVQGQDIYLRDLYVVPSARKAGLATELADEVAAAGKEAGCRRMLGSVSPEDPKATQNIKVLLAYGMRLLNASPALIIFEKEI